MRIGYTAQKYDNFFYTYTISPKMIFGACIIPFAGNYGGKWIKIALFLHLR